MEYANPSPRAPSPSLLPRLAFLALAAALSATAFASTMEGLPGTPFTPSAAPLGHLGLTVGIGATGHTDAELIARRRFLHNLLPVDGEPDTAIIEELQSATLRVNAVLGAASWLDLGVSAPWHLDLIDDTQAKGLSGNGPGDVLLSAKAGGALAGDHVLDAALLLSLSVPSKGAEGFLPKHTGYAIGDTASSPAPPRFHSAFAPGYAGRALLGLDLTRLEAPIPFRAHLDAGLAHPGIGGVRAVLGGSLEWVPLPFFGFFADIRTETRLSRMPRDLGKEVATAAGGLRARSDDGVFVSVGAQKRISDPVHRAFAREVDGRRFSFRSATVPDLALAMTMGWSGALVARDLDGDGVPDGQDPCPNEDEDEDGFQDFDGCPERDNDEDSVPDVKDRCPVEAEDKDGTGDGDGCPDPDNDGDNIPDALDKCPIEPEDLDDFEDFDGCPDLDNDRDGLMDPQDRCPGQAEDKDAFQDADGCPDPDNDGDRVPDAVDQCPAEAESPDGVEDADGCPEASRQGRTPPLPDRILLRSVRFRGSSDEMLPGAYAALDTLAARLLGDPSARVEIRGHVDRDGGELEQHRVSESWAAAVRKYLLLKGVPPGQVSARGMGSREPIASNSSAAGRAQNRRVEVRRLY